MPLKDRMDANSSSVVGGRAAGFVGGVAQPQRRRISGHIGNGLKTRHPFSVIAEAR